MASISPNRPYNEKDLQTQMNGSPVYLGTIVSVAGAVTTNATTATAFAATAQGPTGVDGFPANAAGTLAGKMLLIQAGVAGSVAPGGPTAPTLALQSVVPPVNGTAPGPLLAAGERQIVTLTPQQPLLQWLPTSGAGNLFVWELI